MPFKNTDGLGKGFDRRYHNQVLSIYMKVKPATINIIASEVSDSYDLKD